MFLDIVYCGSGVDMFLNIVFYGSRVDPFVDTFFLSIDGSHFLKWQDE